MSELSDQRCACGCGMFTNIVEKTSVRQGRVKGEASRWVVGHTNRAARTVEQVEAAKLVARQKARASYARNRESRLGSQKVAREADPERFAATSKRTYEKNRAARIANAAQWAAANREKVREAARQRRAANGDAHRARQRDAESRRRARVRGARRVECVDPLLVLEMDDGVCGVCCEDVDATSFHVDHIVPLALGGTHEYANVQVAHPACNLSKGWSL